MKKLSHDYVLSTNAEYESGNLTIEKFAKAKGIKKNTMVWIRKRVKRHSKSQIDSGAEVSFTKIQPLKCPPYQAKEIRLEINSCNIFVEDDFNASTLSRLVQVLRND